MSAEIQTYYARMMNEISKHKDFGKRNPVDIGVECGYGEEDVLKMVKLLSENADEKTLPKPENNYYFLLDRNENGIIVLVNINDWSVRTVKKIPEFFSLDMRPQYNKWQIKGKIFAWETGEVLYWQDLETGKEGEKSFRGESIRAFRICQNGIFVCLDNAFIYIGFDETTRETTSKFNMFREPNLLLLEGEEKIYVVGSMETWSIDKKFQNQERVYKLDEDSYPGINIIDTGIEKGKFYYDCFEKIRIGNYRIADCYRKISENNECNQMIVDNPRPICSDENDFRNIMEGVVTKKYRLLGQKIYTRDGRFGRCIFPIKIDYDNHGQVVGIYDKDIFIGVGEKSCDMGKSSWEENIIKIDLNNDDQPVFLPIGK